MGGRCSAVIAGDGRRGPLVGYRKPWLALLADAGIEDLRVHDLRHTFASYSLSGGQTLGVVGQLQAHWHCSQPAVSRRMNALVKYGLAEVRTTGGRGARWTVRRVGLCKEM